MLYELIAIVCIWSNGPTEGAMLGPKLTRSLSLQQVRPGSLHEVREYVLRDDSRLPPLIHRPLN